MFKDRLKLVRQAAGMTMGQLSAAMTPSVSPKTISKCEKGKFMPSSTVLLGMCKVLGTHLDFLLGGQVESLDCIQWRKHSTVTARDVARAKALVIEKIENYLTIEHILGMASDANPSRE